MATVTIEEARDKLPELIHRLTPGDEVVITENDQPVARLTAAAPTERLEPDARRLIQQAHEAFCRDLGQLIEERPGQWVAYQGNSRIGFAPTKTGLFQLCLSLGLKRGEFLVRSIEPAAGEPVMGLGILEGTGHFGEGIDGAPAS